MIFGQYYSSNSLDTWTPLNDYCVTQKNLHGKRVFSAFNDDTVEMIMMMMMIIIIIIIIIIIGLKK